MIEEYTLSDVLDTSYLHGAASDELLSMTRAGQTYYFYQDGRGDTSQVTDSSGQLVETYRYDPFGAATVTVAPGKTATGTRFTFTGREYFPVSGLYNYRNRFYLPSLGRFLQPDPIGFGGDGANLYRYCGNNPANWGDPSGLAEIKPRTEGIDSGGSSTFYNGRPAIDDPPNYEADPNTGAGDQIDVIGGTVGGSSVPSSGLAGASGITFGSGSRGGGRGDSPWGDRKFSIRTGVPHPLVTVTPLGGTALQRAQLSVIVGRIFGTFRGSQLNALLQARGFGIVLAIRYETQTQTFGTKYISFNPAWRPMVPLVNGQIVSPSWERQIAHELGHALTGFDDHWPGEMINLMLNENPIMEELGESPRGY